MFKTGSFPELVGKVIVVTGGATSIGAAHVEAFCRSGALVAFLDIKVEAGRSLEAAMRANGATACFIPCDLMDTDALAAAIEEVRRTLGPVFGLINNAAVDLHHDFDELTPRDFDWMMGVNLRHVIFAAQQVLPHMRGLGQGSIVNTSSVTWMRGLPDVELYSAAKAAIIGFTNSLAREVGKDRIRVNAIAPGYVATPAQRDKADEARYLALQCLPDLIEPKDIAATAVFLCSNAARMITKQCITINAGSL